MAENQPRPINGEELKLDLQKQSVALSTNNLLSILMLVLIGVGGYLMWVAFNDRLNRIDTALQNVVVTQSASRLYFREVMSELENAIQSLLNTHDYNTGREPSAHLPLSIPRPTEEKVGGQLR